MSRFEEIGVGFQYMARTAREAKQSYEKSCKACCEKGLRIDCDRCGICFAHDTVMAVFGSVTDPEAVSVLVQA